ncbi:MAG: hypothetical protein AABZ45_00690 [Pseudomonadota bacterium]
MGWFLPLLFGALIVIAMARFAKAPRAALELAVVAALIGLAGYAWQGSPNLPGSPRESTARL